MVVQRLRTVAADPGLRTAGVAEAERQVVAVVAVTREAEAAVAVHRVAVVEDTPAGVIRMEDATKIDLTLTARRLRAARFFVEGISLKFALSVLMAFICRWRQIRRIQRLLAFSRWEFGRG
jgi:hypothetical protein